MGISIATCASAPSSATLSSAAQIANQINDAISHSQDHRYCDQNQVGKPEYVIAGKETSGIERYHETAPAWFIGRHRKIKACVVLSKNFKLSPGNLQAYLKGEKSSLTAGEAADYVRKAFKTWEKYMHDHRIQDRYPQGFATDVIVSTDCQGPQDLKVYFGASDPQLDEIRKTFSEPFGFAANVGKSEDPKWRKGVIWIAPPGYQKDKTPIWTAERVFGALLHEVGHVYGNGHVPGTIMRQDLGRHFTVDPVSKSSEEFLTHIDQSRVLYHGNATENLSFTPAPVARSLFSSSFRKLTGRAPVGQIIEKLQVKNSKDLRGTLTLSDSSGSKTTLKLRAHYQFPCASRGENVFTYPSSSSGAEWTSSGTCLLGGKLVNPKTKKAYRISIQQDGGRFRYRIVLFDEPDMYRNQVFTH